jgi:hypothetical protein
MALSPSKHQWRQSHGNKESCKEVRKQKVFEQEVILEEVGLEQERKPQGTREKRHKQEVRFEVVLEEDVQQELRPQVQPECR